MRAEVFYSSYFPYYVSRVLVGGEEPVLPTQGKPTFGLDVS